MMGFKTNKIKSKHRVFLHLNSELSITLTYTINKTKPKNKLGYNF